MAILSLRNITYSYEEGRQVLRGINEDFEEGKMYAILGPSGCGKTTLLSILGGLDRPKGGELLVNGEVLREGKLPEYRRDHIAFVFQSYNLIDYLTPAENISLTTKLPPLPILERLGLTRDEARRSVLKLSGGQQQRVAVARALASDARILLADEPTGNLDEETAGGIIDILQESAHDSGKCVVVVTHSSELAKRADQSFRLKRGVLNAVGS